MFGRHGSFRSVFPQGHVVLPVVHVTDRGQALRNVDVAREAGADGVFLINHTIGAGTLLEIHATVMSAHPGWWVGVNCLGLDPTEVFSRVDADVAGVWTDNAGVREDSDEQPEAEDVLAALGASRWSGLYFGGVAFKYQRPVEDVRAAARRAAPYMDVVTTSGPGTGEAAALAKIAAMKEVMGDAPLAIASGVTPDNVIDYLPHSDCYLVATGISREFDELDAALTMRLVERVRAYDADAPGSR